MIFSAQILEKENKPENPFQTMTSQKMANIIPLTSPDLKNLHEINNIAKMPQNYQNSKKFLELSKLTNC